MAASQHMRAFLFRRHLTVDEVRRLKTALDAQKVAETIEGYMRTVPIAPAIQYMRAHFDIVARAPDPMVGARRS